MHSGLVLEITAVKYILHTYLVAYLIKYLLLKVLARFLKLWKLYFVFHNNYSKLSDHCVERDMCAFRIISNFLSSISLSQPTKKKKNRITQPTISSTLLKNVIALIKNTDLLSKWWRHEGSSIHQTIVLLHITNRVGVNRFIGAQLDSFFMLAQCASN